MRRVIIGTAAVAVLVLSGCGDDDGGDESADPAVEEVAETSTTEAEEEVTWDDLEEVDPADLPTCDELFEEGRVITQAELDTGCTEEGEWMLLGSAVEECADGRVLRWNDEAWWYEGEGVHPHEPGAELVAPEAEREACYGS